MNTKKRTLVALLALAGTVAAGTAQARDVDIRWQVAIPGPVSVVVGNTAPRVYLPPPPVYVVPAPRVVYPGYVVHPGYGQPGWGPGWGDRDRDGIPNRYDRRYNPRWDVDGDGIPNRHDRYDNRRWHGEHRHHDNRRDWRDRRGGDDD